MAFNDKIKVRETIKNYKQGQDNTDKIIKNDLQ